MLFFRINSSYKIQPFTTGVINKKIIPLQVESTQIFYRHPESMDTSSS